MNEFLQKMEINKTFINKIRNRYLKFLGYIMRKESVDNLTVTGYIKSKRNRGKECITYLTNLCKWLAKQEISRFSKDTKFTKEYKGREVVANHDYPLPEEICCIEKEGICCLKVSSISLIERFSYRQRRHRI